MFTNSIVENPPTELWNSFLREFPNGNFEQSYEYGEICKMAFPKTKVSRLAIIRNGELIGIIQGTYSSYLGFGMSFRTMRGPLVNTEKKERLQLIENLLKALEKYCKKNRIIHTHMLVPEAWQIYSVFDKLGYTSAGKLNEYFVNLEKGADEIWKNIAHNKRRNIRKAEKEGVEIIQSRNHDDLLTFYSMLEAAEKRRGFISYPLSWFEAVWKLYKPEVLSKVFIARWKEKSVSGVFVVIHGRTVYALAAGSFSEGWKVRSNDMMHWKIMEWACQNGYSKYHMGLVSAPPPTEGTNTWGIWRWKREWNGSLAPIQIFDKMFLSRYKLILKGKKLIERVHTGIKRLR